VAAPVGKIQQVRLFAKAAWTFLDRQPKNHQFIGVPHVNVIFAKGDSKGGGSPLAKNSPFLRSAGYAVGRAEL